MGGPTAKKDAHDQPAHATAASTSCADEQKEMFSCPMDGCVRVFQRVSALDRHLSVEACEQMVERKTLLDLAKEQYAERLQERVGAIPSICPSTSAPGDRGEAAAPGQPEGWPLKEAKREGRFNEKQKSYLKSKFDIGVRTGRKQDPEVVAQDMRRARGHSGERLFTIAEFLTPQQIASYFSRLASQAKHQQDGSTPSDEDVNAAVEENNFTSMRQAALDNIHLQHPIVVDQYDVCELIRSQTLKNLKVGMLQILCKELGLDIPSAPVRRKAPYIHLLESLVKECSCMTSVA